MNKNRTPTKYGTMNLEISRKTPSPKQIGFNHTIGTDTVSDARCSKLPPPRDFYWSLPPPPPMPVDEATPNMFSSMFTAYGKNNCARKSKRFTLNRLRDQDSKHESIIREERNKCSSSSTNLSNLNDQIYDGDTASLTSSDVSSIALAQGSCQAGLCLGSDSLFERLFTSFSCTYHTEVELSDSLSSFD